MRAIVEGGEVIESLRERIWAASRPKTCCTRNPRVLVPAGTMLDEDTIEESRPSAWTKSRCARR